MTIVVLAGWVFSVCLHEFSHAVVAYWGGDRSVKDKGYLTFNPLKYTDATTSIMMPLLFLMLGGLALPGGAVYIDRARISSRWWQSTMSAAGPLSNLALAGLMAWPFSWGIAPRPSFSSDATRWQDFTLGSGDGLWAAFAFLAMLQVVAVVLNLLPIPSLDGFGIIEPWLPQYVHRWLRGFYRYGIWMVFAAFWLFPPTSSGFWLLVWYISEAIGIPHDLASIGSDAFQQGSKPLLMFLGIAYLIFTQYAARHNPRQVGDRYFQARSYAEALRAYDRAIQRDPDDADAWYGRGQVLSKTQQWGLAIEAYQRVHELQPDRLEALTMQVAVYLELQQYDRAEHLAQKCIREHPRQAEAWIWLSLTAERQHQWSEALISCDRALSCQPESPSYQIYRAELLEKLERWPEAKQIYDHLIQQPTSSAIWSEQVQAYVQRARLYRQRHCWLEALQDYNWALEQWPQNAQLWYERAAIYEHLQQPTLALEDYERCLDRQPQFYPAWLGRGHSLLTLKQWHRAQLTFEQALKLNPQGSDSIVGLSMAVWHLGERQRAMQMLQELVGRDRDHALAWYNLAYYHLDLADLESATICLRKAIQLDRASTAPADLLALSQAEAAFAPLWQYPDFVTWVEQQEP